MDYIRSDILSKYFTNTEIQEAAKQLEDPIKVWSKDHKCFIFVSQKGWGPNRIPRVRYNGQEILCEYIYFPTNEKVCHDMQCINCINMFTRENCRVNYKYESKIGWAV